VKLWKAEIKKEKRKKEKKKKEPRGSFTAFAKTRRCRTQYIYIYFLE
jgi:hypothetical protein